MWFTDTGLYIYATINQNRPRSRNIALNIVVAVFCYYRTLQASEKYYPHAAFILDLCLLKIVLIWSLVKNGSPSIVRAYMTELDMFACVNNNKRYQHSALYFLSLSEVLQLRKEFEHFNNYNYIGTSICLPGKCKAYFATNINFVSFGTLSYSPWKFLSFFNYNSSNIGLSDIQTRLINRIADSNFDLLVAKNSLSIWHRAEQFICLGQKKLNAWWE